MLPALLLGFAGVMVFFYFFTSVPLPEDIGARSTVILASDGTEVGTLQADTSRSDVDLDDLPPYVARAVLAAEDARFYRHGGVSFAGILRAALRNAASGEITQGGSTISQQYIKNVTSDDELSLLRKAREAALAVKLERSYSKDQILEFYMNSIYWGRGAYGIEAAAKAYFGKSATQLTVAEAAQLAGIIAAPSAYDPGENPAGARRRYAFVLQQMVSNGWLDAARAGRLEVESPVTREARGVVFKRAPFFLQLVGKELARELGAERIYQGLVVTTTLDVRLQRKAERVYRERFVASGIRPSGALVAVDNASGGIRALVGGKNYARSQLNLAKAPRQAGSTFKPFALAAYVAEGKSPENYFDAPAEITFTEQELEEALGRDQPDGKWSPENYGGAAYDEISLREATWKSVNTVYAQLILEVGPEKAAEVAAKAGVDRKLPPVPSLVLGTANVTPLEMAEAFSTFASGGAHHEAHTVQEVRRDGRVLYREDAGGEQVLSEQVALTVTDVLQGVIDSGTGTAADIGRPAAGKTGTTQNNADAWFAGYTPQLTAVVWMGNVKGGPMGDEYTGGGLPAETWHDFMLAALDGVPVEAFPTAPGGLLITRPSPTPTVLACPEDEESSETADGTRVCVEPTEEATQPPAPTEAEPTSSPPPATEAPEPEPSPEPSPEPEPSAEPSPKPKPSPDPSPKPSPKPEPSPEPEPSPDPSPDTEPSPTPDPEPSETTEATPPKASEKPDRKPPKDDAGDPASGSGDG